MTRTRLKPSGVARHPTQGTLMQVTYDVVVESTAPDGPGENCVAVAIVAPIAVDAALIRDFEEFLARVGLRMEQAVGLSDTDTGVEPGEESLTTAADKRDEEEGL